MADRAGVRGVEVRVGEERMDAKRFVSGVLVTLLAVGVAGAQSPILAPQAPPVAPDAPPPAPPLGSAAPGIVMAPGGYDIPGVSNWIRRGDGTSPCHSCNGPIGGNSGIGEELYFRTGPSIPLGEGLLLSRNLAVGFTVQGGARTLFYNQAYDKAWAVDFGMSNSFNSGVTRGDTIILPTGTAAPGLPVTIREVNRTFVNFGGGREWFMYPALNQPAYLRFGIDAGGRWGSAKFSLNETGARTDVVGGAYLGSHVMYEFPFHDSIVNVGFRTEYSYTWSDVFYRKSDLSELNLLVNLGVRY